MCTQPTTHGEARCISIYRDVISGTVRSPSRLTMRLYQLLPGDLIRYGPNQVLSLYPSDMAGIYSHGKPFRKSKGYATMVPIPDGWSTMTSIDKTLHHNLRRVFRSGVSAESLARHEPAILRNLAVYFSQLTKTKDREGWSAAADMRKWSESKNALKISHDTLLMHQRSVPRVRHYGRFWPGAKDRLTL